MLIGALDLHVDDAARQDDVIGCSEREGLAGDVWTRNWPGLLIPDGFGSTETEMIELVTLPAIRPWMAPPPWARGLKWPD